MSRYFICLSYDGAHYHGWQRQPNGISVEETVEHALSLLFGKSIDIVGAGRTDAGVNAEFMPAHFDVTEGLPVVAVGGSCSTPEEMLQFKLNRMLPRDIAVEKILRVRDEAHARFDAIERTYHYYVTTRKNPFRAAYYYRIPFRVDFNAMNAAAARLVRNGNFACFAKAHSDVRTTVCDVRRAVWVDLGNDTWRFEITANRFLRNMVRAIVGTLLDVGRGRMSPADMETLLATCDRRVAGESVTGTALFLHDVKYPANIFYP